MKDDLILAEVDGEGMLIDVERGMSFFLNETGLIIYSLLKQGKSDKEIQEALLMEYHAGEEEIGEDIRAFRVLLQEKAILWGKKDI